MPLALPALELVPWLTFAVVLILAVTVKYWLTPIFYVVDQTLGRIPFAGSLFKTPERYVIGKLNQVIAASRAAMTTALQGFRWSVLELAKGVRDFADVVADNWKQLVEVAIPGAMAALWAAHLLRHNSLVRQLEALVATVKSNLTGAEAYADSAVSLAVATTERYADKTASDLWDRTVSHVHGVYQTVEADIAGATTAVTGYVDASVGALRRAEDAAIDAARSSAATALETARRELTAGIGAVANALAATSAALEAELGQVRTGAAQALTAAETALRATIATAVADAERAASTALAATAGQLEQTITEARSAASSALAAAAATLEADLGNVATAAAADLHATATALQGAIGTVADLATATASELTAVEHAAAGELADIYGLPTEQIRALLDRLDLTKLIGFGAGLVLVRSLVEAIATEAGLDDAACRAKHKQVCGVDSSEWTDLLAAGAFLTGALSLGELLPPARVAMGELVGLIRQAA